MRTPQEQSTHDAMVSAVATSLSSQGFLVQADHIGWTAGAPNAIGGYRPDVVATATGKGSLIIEVETASSYNSDDARYQLTAFSNAQGGVCYVVVPQATKGMMEWTLLQWGLANKVQVATYNSGVITWK